MLLTHAPFVSSDRTAKVLKATWGVPAIISGASGTWSVGCIFMLHEGLWGAGDGDYRILTIPNLLDVVINGNSDAPRVNGQVRYLPSGASNTLVNYGAAEGLTRATTSGKWLMVVVTYNNRGSRPLTTHIYGEGFSAVRSTTANVGVYNDTDPTHLTALSVGRETSFGATLQGICGVIGHVFVLNRIMSASDVSTAFNSGKLHAPLTSAYDGVGSIHSSVLASLFMGQTTMDLQVEAASATRLGEGRALAAKNLAGFLAGTYDSFAEAVPVTNGAVAQTWISGKQATASLTVQGVARVLDPTQHWTDSPPARGLAGFTSSTSGSAPRARQVLEAAHERTIRSVVISNSRAARTQLSYGPALTCYNSAHNDLWRSNWGDGLMAHAFNRSTLVGKIMSCFGLHSGGGSAGHSVHWGINGGNDSPYNAQITANKIFVEAPDTGVGTVASGRNACYTRFGVGKSATPASSDGPGRTLLSGNCLSSFMVDPNHLGTTVPIRLSLYYLRHWGAHAQRIALQAASGSTVSDSSPTTHGSAVFHIATDSAQYFAIPEETYLGAYKDLPNQISILWTHGTLSAADINYLQSSIGRMVHMVDRQGSPTEVSEVGVITNVTWEEGDEEIEDAVHLLFSHDINYQPGNSDYTHFSISNWDVGKLSVEFTGSETLGGDTFRGAIIACSHPSAQPLTAACLIAYEVERLDEIGDLVMSWGWSGAGWQEQLDAMAPGFLQKFYTAAQFDVAWSWIAHQNDTGAGLGNYTDEIRLATPTAGTIEVVWCGDPTFHFDDAVSVATMADRDNDDQHEWMLANASTYGVPRFDLLEVFPNGWGQIRGHYGLMSDGEHPGVEWYERAWGELEDLQTSDPVVLPENGSTHPSITRDRPNYAEWRRAAPR